jgi:DNA-binding MarR family transcriptional regulator
MEKYIGFEIRTLANLLKREIYLTEKLENDNSTNLHGVMIEYLVINQDKDIYQKNLEDEFAMRRSTATRMLQLMEKNGMIRRVQVSKDARMKKIILTQKAMESHQYFMNSRLKIEKKIRKGITDGELETFFLVAEKIKANLE